MTKQRIRPQLRCPRCGTVDNYLLTISQEGDKTTYRCMNCDELFDRWNSPDKCPICGTKLDEN